MLNLRALKKQFLNIIRRILTKNIDFYEEQFRYGHREVLLHYSQKKLPNLLPNLILQGSIDHGWAPHENIWKMRKKNFNYANRYVWKESRVNNYSKRNKAIAVGAPWLYMLADLGITKENVELKLPKKTNKVIIFPGHSDISNANTSLLKQVGEMKNRIPVGSDATVCLYWVDYLNPILRKEIENLDLKVFCAGFVSQIPYQDTNIAGRPNFLLELFDLLKDAELVVVSELATASFYAMTLGSRICYVSQETSSSWQSHNNLSKNENQLTNNFFASTSEWINKYMKTLYSTYDTPQSFVDFAWTELGLDSFNLNSNAEKFIWETATVNLNSLATYEERLNKIKMNINEQTS
jgi:hypothetical protein